jgi:hypothetical protein
MKFTTAVITLSLGLVAQAATIASNDRGNNNNNNNNNNKNPSQGNWNGQGQQPSWGNQGWGNQGQGNQGWGNQGSQQPSNGQQQIGWGSPCVAVGGSCDPVTQLFCSGARDVRIELPCLSKGLVGTSCCWHPTV